jgi:hypothetical protein
MNRAARFSLSLGLIASGLLSTAAWAVDFRVTSGADLHDARPGDHRCAAANGTCTLRAAIEEANASRGQDTIRFHLEHESTIVLTLGYLEISGEGALKIVGPGAGALTLDGNGASRLIRVFADATAEISGLTLRNGFVDHDENGDRAFGGAVENLGTLTLREVAITGNRAPQGGGGILNMGTLNVLRSTVHGNSAGAFAGGILNGGSMLLVDSSVNGNDASDGAGGIDNRGTATLSRSSVRDNTSINHAAGIESRGTLSLVESTVAGNIADNGAGGVENFNSLSLFQSAITGNRSNIAGGLAGTRGDISIASSRVTGNRGGTGPLDPSADCSLSPIAVFRSGGGNLFGDGTGCAPEAGDALASPGAVDDRSAAIFSAESPAPMLVPATSPFEVHVAASTDDAEESAAGAMYLNSSDLELVYDGSNQTVGMRFNGVSVPKGASITNAWIQFTVDEAQSEATTLFIQGQAVDNATTFTTAKNNVSGRARTTASVRWDPVPWSTIGQAGLDQRTPNLSAVVQEVVNRQGWSSGNSLVIVITGTGHRTADAYDESTTGAALLHIEYQTASGSGGNTAPVVYAGPDLPVTLPAGASLAGTVTDDGLPNPPAAVTCAWSTTSGPGAASFASASSPATTATFPASGTYILRLTCSDGALQAFDEATITVSPAVTSPPPTLDIRVSAATDDAEESASGSVSTSSSDLELVYDGSNQTVGMRFNGVQVPRGATIASAWIQFTVDEAQSEATALLIQGQAIDNAPTFSSTSKSISSRARTAASATWNPVPWSTIGQAGTDQRTPSFASVIQEIVNRQGWSPGNSLVIIITGTGHRTADAYDESTTGAALLHIQLQSSSTGNTAPVVSAGPDGSTTIPSPVTLSGSVSDDGLPIPPGAVTCAWSTSSGPAQAAFGNPAQPATTATFTVSGTYVLRLTCNDGALQAFDETTIAVAASNSPIAVYAGYYDTHHSDNLKPRPDPWQGSSGVVFAGTPDTSSGGWDTSAVRVDNLTGSTLSNVVVTVDVGSDHFALWPAKSIPAGGKLIIAQTGYENFDGSDLNAAGCYGCDSKLCTTAVSSTIPVVHVTAGGQTYNIPDPGQVLNTHGVDSAGCPYTGTRNDESQTWIQIH